VIGLGLQGPYSGLSESTPGTDALTDALTDAGSQNKSMVLVGGP